MNERELRGLVCQVRRGQLPRRAFVQQMAALGIGAPLVAAMLGNDANAQAAPATAYKPTKRGGGGTLRMLYWQGPTLLNPHFATGTKDSEGARPFHEPMVYFDAEARAIPVLAAELPSKANGGIAADGRSVTWKLKRGVQWHDGKPFTADDVVFNWQYATDPAAAAFTIGLYQGVKSVDAVDTHTVRVVFESPNPVWTTGADVMLVPKHLFDAYRGGKAREAPNNLKPVGTGPYKFADFKPGDLVRGELNPNYHMPNRPHFDAVEIKGGGDATSAARAVLQTGEYDYAWNTLVEDEVLKRMESAGKGRVSFTNGGNTEYMVFNMTNPAVEVDGERSSPKSRHPAFSDPVVRQAMALLLDRKAVQEFVYGRTGVATANVLNNPAAFNSSNLRAEFNLDKANALLDGAGWKRPAGSADGVREKGGVKMRFVHQTSTNSVRQKVQQIYKQSCAKAGIDLELKSVVASVFFSSDVANPDTYGKFFADMQMFAFTRTPDPRRFMQSFTSAEVSSRANKWTGLNNGRWTNADYDAAHKAAEQELDPVKRAALFIRMNDLVCNDHHVLPVVFRPSVNAMGRGLVGSPSPWDVSVAAIHDWYREG